MSQGLRPKTFLWHVANMMRRAQRRRGGEACECVCRDCKRKNGSPTGSLRNAHFVAVSLCSSKPSAGSSLLSGGPTRQSSAIVPQQALAVFSRAFSPLADIRFAATQCACWCSLRLLLALPTSALPFRSPSDVPHVVIKNTGFQSRNFLRHSH